MIGRVDVVSLYVLLLRSTYHIMNKPRCVLVDLVVLKQLWLDQRLIGRVACVVSLHVPLLPSAHHIIEQANVIVARKLRMLNCQGH
jgi:phosphoglycerate dehydrogenase-like enzyme